MRRRALVSSYYVPQFDRDCASRRIFDFIAFLREADWRVDFVAANGCGPARYTHALQQQGVAVHDDSRATSGADISGPFDRLVQSARFDLALFVFWPLARFYLPKLRRLAPSTRVLVSSEDIHFLREARRLVGGAGTVLGPELGEAFVEETNTYLAADAVIAVSQKEAEFLAHLLGRHLSLPVVPLSDDVPPSPLALQERSGALLVGSYQHPPNIDALQFLFHDVVPHIEPSLLARHPIEIVGNSLDAGVASLTRTSEHVRLVGWVPSVAPYFHRARISLVPLRYGAGTKGKMVQALMSLTPTVCTSIGAEGLDLTHGEHVLIADDAASFARATEQLLSDDDLWQKLAANGRAHVLRNHTRDTVRQHFLAAVEATLASPAKPALLSEESASAYSQRLFAQYRAKSAPALARIIASEAAGATVLVASGGDPAFLSMGEHTVWPFPRGTNGYADPGSFGEAGLVEHLEELRAQGARWLFVPLHTAWVIDRHAALRRHLESTYRRIDYDASECFGYELRVPSARVAEAERGYHRSVEQAGGLKLSGAPLRARLIAFYLPQYHPIAQNDGWWGEGFTDWRNVAKARSLFPAHQQPRLPADLGFYDLRLAETRAAQAALAGRYGIHGFCYYHYWFHGERLLERPFDAVLRSREPEFPYALCWANEPWSRRWDGLAHDVLQAQTYSAEDDLNHIRWLLQALADPRAITIDGKPIFLVYQAQHLPDAQRTTDLWRGEVERAGLKGLYLMAVETGWDAGWDATQVGFDAKVLFQPQFSLLSTVPQTPVAEARLRVFDYATAWPILANPQAVSYRRYESVFPSWDNSPRRDADAWVLHNSTPEQYERWLALAIERAQAHPRDERIVFINAWNEWAEGCHLEPDQQHGLAYLEATARALATK